MAGSSSPAISPPSSPSPTSRSSASPAGKRSTSSGNGSSVEPASLRFMSSPTPAVSEIGQIALVVGDVAQATNFYRDVLGLKFLFPAGPNMAFFAAGSIRIMLTTPQGAGE